MIRMRQLTTDNGTYEADFAWATDQDTLLIQVKIPPEKRLSEIAQEFDGLQHINYINEDVGIPYNWDGFSDLDMIQRLQGGSIQMRLKNLKMGENV